MSQTDTYSRKRGRPENPELAARRREDILHAATEEFASRGFAKTDLQVVADRLKVGKGTVYRYFPSKQALFLACADRGMRRLHEHIEAAASNAGEPLQRIELALRAYLAFFDANPEVIELIIQERAAFRDRREPTYFEHKNRNMAPWEALMQDLINQGRVRAIPPERITGVLSDLLYGTMFTNYFSGPSKTLEVQTDEILDVVMKGILTTPGALKRPTRKRKSPTTP